LDQKLILSGWKLEEGGSKLIKLPAMLILISIVSLFRLSDIITNKISYSGLGLKYGFL